MAFFTFAIPTLQTFVVALSAGLGVRGTVNLLEGYGNDNPGSNAQVLTVPLLFRYVKAFSLVCPVYVLGALPRLLCGRKQQKLSQDGG